MFNDFYKIPCKVINLKDKTDRWETTKSRLEIEGLNLSNLLLNLFEMRESNLY